MDEVELFIELLKKESDVIYDLVLDETEYGYFIDVMGNNEGYLWTMQLRLYFDNDHEFLSYLMVQFFQVSIRNRGHGVDLFNRLLRCSHAFKHLVMIRLAAGDEVGEKFWLRKNHFRLKGDIYDEITGDSKWFDIDCLKKPAQLNLYRYIYDVRRCECASCRSYYRES